MVSEKEIEKLSRLCRIKLASGEKKELQKDLGTILDYVEKLKQAPLCAETVYSAENTNKTREDAEGHKPGEYSQEIINQAPSAENGYIKVKKII